MSPEWSMFLAGFIAGATFMFYIAWHVIGRRKS